MNLGEHHVMIVDDDEAIRKACELILFKEGIKPITCDSATKALEMLKKYNVDVVVTDNRMPEMSGMDLLSQIKRQDPAVEIIVMTAFAEMDLAIQALKHGAFDFFTKPFDNIDKFVQSVRNAMSKRDLSSYTQRLEKELKQQFKFHNIVGTSPAMQRVNKLIKDVAPSSSSVMITGASGTGKELVARAIHFNSPRHNRPFVAINCSAITETLLDSELFGHVKGSFTGAIADKKGFFEEAHTGTLFLDEIGDIPMATQVRLLRVLQEGEIRRVGSNEVRTVDVRIIAATHQSLEALVSKGTFREDLYYRLNVISIHLPALKDRREDIPLLAMHFLKNMTAREKKSIKGFTDETMRALENYPWPGNVRELENMVERAVVLEKGSLVTAESLPPQIATHGAAVDSSRPESLEPIVKQLAYKEAKARYMEQFHRNYVAALLKATGGNLSHAARIAGLDRTNFKRILKRIGLDRESYRNDFDGSSGAEAGAGAKPYPADSPTFLWRKRSPPC